MSNSYEWITPFSHHLKGPVVQPRGRAPRPRNSSTIRTLYTYTWNTWTFAYYQQNCWNWTQSSNFLQCSVYCVMTMRASSVTDWFCVHVTSNTWSRRKLTHCYDYPSWADCANLCSIHQSTSSFSARCPVPACKRYVVNYAASLTSRVTAAVSV